MALPQSCSIMTPPCWKTSCRHSPCCWLDDISGQGGEACVSRNCGWPPADSQQEARALTHSHKPDSSPRTLHRYAGSLRIKPKYCRGSHGREQTIQPSRSPICLSAPPLQQSTPSAQESQGTRTPTHHSHRETQGSKKRKTSTSDLAGWNQFSLQQFT